ncbi:MAG: hypothetical protein ACPGJS_11055 [Flammeovirgaceae bacterium]
MRTFFMLFLLGFACSIQAQDSEKMQYLLDGNVKVSGFGGPTIDFSSIKGELAVSNGGGGAVLLNNTYFFGGYGTGLSNRIQLDVGSIDNANLRFGHGGLWLGYIHKPEQMIHFGGSLKLGWGHVDLDQRDFNIIGSPRLLDDNVFVLVPQGEVEVNVTKWFKINAALGYRAVTGLSDNDYLEGSDLSSLNFSLGFLFGWYGR